MSNTKNTTRRPEMSAIPESKAMACRIISCLPKSFTWLTAKDRCPSLVQIRNQSCGSCWAVAAAAVISDRHCLQMHENRIFSAKEITDCAINDGCHGGDPKEAMDYYVNHGVVSGGDPTVRGQRKGCLPNQNIKDDQTKCDLCKKCEQKCDLTYDVPFTEDKRKGIHSYQITSKDVNDIKLDLIMYGPLVATMKAFEDFENYSGGIYRRTSNNIAEQHAVRMIGWGEENGVQYWICANSWGTNWGENGYFRIVLGHNECNIEEYLLGVDTKSKENLIIDNTTLVPFSTVATTQRPEMSAIPGSKVMVCQDISCLPKSFTWLTAKDRCPSLVQIRNQICGNSWAVAAAAVISDRHCLQMHENRIFSAKEITDCAIKDGCYGGDPKDAMDYYVTHGVVTGGDATVREQRKGCQPNHHIKDEHTECKLCSDKCQTTCDITYDIPFNEDKQKGFYSYQIVTMDINEIKLDLMMYGPLVATMKVFEDFKNYSEGIYRRTSNHSTGQHAVRMIGWGEENGVQYWICVNSWGTNWGENGYFRIALGHNECHIEEYLLGVDTKSKENLIIDNTTLVPFSTVATTRRPEMSAIPKSKVMVCQDISCLPKSFTWLTAKDRCPSLVQIRKQICGNSWAVAAAAVISDRHCLQMHENRIFSAKEITDCAINDGCHGGDPKEAMDYYVNHGVVSGGDPTVRGQRKGCLPNQNIKDGQTKCDLCEKCEQKCDLTYDVPFTEDKRKGIHSYTITSKDVNEIKLDLMMYGPLVARIDLFEDFKNYSEGIYRRTSEKKINVHAVRIIGWGEEDGLPHWICANSWGANWGENGFFRMPLGQNECNVEEYLVGVEVENKPYIADPTQQSKPVHVSPTSWPSWTPVQGPPENPTVEPAQRTSKPLSD